jgi:adenylate cyclase
VYQFEGWIANFTGDGIVAIFEDHEDGREHAQRACDAAFAIREALNAHGQGLLPEREPALPVRIGINSDEVLTGTIGGRHSRYYTATGYAVSLAKRIESLAMPGRVYVSEDTAALLNRWKLHDLGAFAVKGVQSPIEAFELVGQSGVDRYVPVIHQRA